MDKQDKLVNKINLAAEPESQPELPAETAADTEEFIDDGHTVVNMNVDGVPGSMMETLFGALARRNPHQRLVDDDMANAGYKQAKAREAASSLSQSQDQSVPPPLSRREFWALTLHSYLAALFILSIFLAAFGLLIWFIIRNN
ncbi:MAG: hypothetical protein Q4D97_02115 [Eubacteriales bacterium]|nr:hypothetical protein [Eubacteriales bacterium]